MKQLDEMERMAREWTDGCADMRAVDTASELARALLAVMPVVRAAITVAPDDIEDGPDWDDENWLKFGDAIDDLRRRLGGE